jgi:hypothetical protein
VRGAFKNLFDVVTSVANHASQPGRLLVRKTLLHEVDGSFQVGESARNGRYGGLDAARKRSSDALSSDLGSCRGAGTNEVDDRFRLRQVNPTV